MYPYNIITKKIASLLGGQNFGQPLYLDLSASNPDIFNSGIATDQVKLNQYIDKELAKHNKRWMVSSYLEYREPLLKKYAQMQEERRYYHLGVDVILPLGARLYAPIEGAVKEAYYEEGAGNYGGLVVLEHNIDGYVFYSLYGHLNKENLPDVGRVFMQGEFFATIGDLHENGFWFYHTHLQVLTKEAYDSGWVSKGYCTEKDLATISKYCPDPTFLLKA